MDIKKIQIDNYEWTSNTIVEQIRNEDLEGRFYSWGEFSVPTIFTKCNGNNLAIRKCTISYQLFIECDFQKIDASDSTFVDCLFLNCIFTNANFHKANFIGTAIVQDENFQVKRLGAGMSQTKFKSSNLNNSILSNLKLDGCSFRHSVFENAVWNKITIEYTSLEDAYFNNCTIDTLNLRSSACRGIIIQDCTIKKYISSLEKTLGGIGILQTLDRCEEIELYVFGNKINSIDLLADKLDEVSLNFLSEGKLFEFINIINYLYTRVKETEKQHALSSEFSLQLSFQDGFVNNYPVSKKGELLYHAINSAYATINANGNRINLDDILYSLKLMFFLDIHEYALLILMLNIYQNEVSTRQNDYSDLLVLSQIKHYFQVLGELIRENRYRITLHNNTALWNNKDDRNDFYEFCKQFISIEETADCKLVSMHEGSIEIVFEFLFSGKILIPALILGCNLEIKDGKISFSFNPIKGIKTYTQLIKALLKLPSVKTEKITEREFDSIYEETNAELKKYITDNEICGKMEPNNALQEVDKAIRKTKELEKTKETARIEFF